MWVTKLFISPVKIRIFCPKTTKFGPKLAFLFILGQALLAHLVGGCGAQAVSRKTPIYFISSNWTVTFFAINRFSTNKERKLIFRIICLGPLPTYVRLACVL